METLTTTKNQIDTFFDAKRKVWEVEDFIITLRSQICSMTPKYINLHPPTSTEQVSHLCQVAHQLDIFFNLFDYLNDKITAFYQREGWVE